MAEMSHQSDAMIARLEKEMAEREAFIQGTVAGAEDRGGDLTSNETEMIQSAKGRVDVLRSQLEMLWDTRQSMTAARLKVNETYAEMSKMRYNVDKGPVEYRSAGEYILDVYNAYTGKREAKERLEMFMRAAAHQTTADNLGIIPDPIVGDVINFIDSGRPLVSYLGARPLTNATWYRPKVTQHTAIAAQAAEKNELTSQKLLLTRLTGTAATYGGYVNVSRQDVDFSSPNALDIVVNDLASVYAVQTEAIVGALLLAAANTIELTTVFGSVPTAAELTAGLWAAVAAVYTATKGAPGRIGLAVSPAMVGYWGPLFSPVAQLPNAQVSGFTAGNFGQGILGYISGIPVIMSGGISGAATDFGMVFHTAGTEVYEQKLGSLQAVEPSVLGIQVAYAGYFAPLTIEAAATQRIVNAA